MSDNVSSTGTPAAAGGEVFDAGRAEAFAREQIAHYHSDASVKQAEMAVRYAKTATKIQEVPLLIREFLGASGTGRSGSTSAPTAPPAPAAPSNTGAPAPTPGGLSANLPDNPYKWPPEVTDRMTAPEYRQAIREYEERSGFGHPFAAHRARMEEMRGKNEGARIARELETINRRLARLGR